MSERIDRKQLDLKKFVPAALSPTGRDEVHGVLYKGKQWGYEIFMGHYEDNEYLAGNDPRTYYNRLGDENWCNYDFKYPDYETEAVEWKPLYDAVKFVATSSQNEFDTHLAEYFDFPVLRDYYLFLDVLLATDNHGKNVYFFAYDQASASDRKLSLAPWDLDAILGINWQSDYTRPTPDWDLDDYLRTYEHGQHTLFIKLRNSTRIPWKTLLARRYAELRPNHFNKDSLIARVTRYADLFAASQADQREEAKWEKYNGGWHANLQEGARFITDWLDERIDVLDRKYGYDPIAASVNEAVADSYFQVRGDSRAILVTCGRAQLLPLYHVSGRVVRTVQLHEGDNRITAVEPGIYILAGHKVVVRP